MALLKPTYEHYMKQARYLEVLQAIMPAKLAVIQCFYVTQDLSMCQSGDQSIPHMPVPQQGLISSLTIKKGGIIHVIPKIRYGFTKKDDLYVTPSVDQGHLMWTLSGGAVVQGYVQGR